MYHPTTKNGDRVSFTTSINKKLLLKLKVLAAKKEVPMNQIIEEALKHYYKL